MHDAPEEIREYLDVLGRSLHEQRVARERTPLRAALDRFQGNSDDAMAAFESAPAWDEIMDHIGALNQTRPPHSSAWVDLLRRLGHPAASQKAQCSHRQVHSTGASRSSCRLQLG